LKTSKPMPDMKTIQLALPILGVRVLNRIENTSAAQDAEEQAGAKQPGAASDAERERLTRELTQEKSELAGLHQTVSSIACKLDKLYQDTVTGNRAEIARLAVEIAKKILMHEVARGNYDIQAIVEEALKRAPTRQNIVIRLNPEDLPRCQQHQQENPDSPFAQLELTADWSVGRAECLVETPKGIIKSFIEEHLEHINEALQKAE
jgi:flagellar biosynthesis/type III secretory pathway protein FliH